MKGIISDSISHPHALSLLKSEYIMNYDVLLFYDFVTDMPKKDSVIYLNLTYQGMPMLFLHHAICSFQQWDGYKQLIGGKYIEQEYASDPDEISDYQNDLDLQIKVANNKHPVTRGVSDFTIHDEGYSNIQMRGGITPLLQTDHPECSSIVGWVNHFDRSTCIYLMFGHDQQAYLNKNFRQLIENSILWLAIDQQRL